MAPCSRAQGRGTFADADDHRWCKQRNHQAEDELFALDVTLDFEKERASDALAKTEGRYSCDASRGTKARRVFVALGRAVPYRRHSQTAHIEPTFEEPRPPGARQLQLPSSVEVRK